MKDLIAMPDLDFLEPDAAVAYAMALENRVTSLAEKLFLPCMDSGWGSQDLCLQTDWEIGNSRSRVFPL